MHMYHSNRTIYHTEVMWIIQKTNVRRNYLAGTTKLKIGLSIIYFTTTLISSNVSKTDSLTNIAMKQQQITQ